MVQNEEVIHEFNQHVQLNNVLQKLALKTGDVIAAASNTPDYDNVILENEKTDAVKTYKMSKAYQPGVGNTPVAHKMDETLHRPNYWCASFRIQCR